MGSVYKAQGSEDDLFVVAITGYYESQKYVFHTHAQYLTINLLIRVNVSCLLIQTDKDKKLSFGEKRDIVVTKFVKKGNMTEAFLQGVVEYFSTSPMKLLLYVFMHFHAS